MKALAINSETRKLLITGLVIIAFVTAINLVAAHLVLLPIPTRSVQSALGVFLIAVFVSPPIEEIVFRGFALSLLSPIMGFWGAAIISTSAWLGLHLLWPGIGSPVWVVCVFTLGIILSALRRKTGSLWPCIIGHSCFNAVGASFILGRALS